MGGMKNNLRPLLFYGGLPFVKIYWRRISGKCRIFILMYHRVDYEARPFFETVVPPDVFERQVRFLSRHYEIVDLKDLKMMERGGDGKDLVILTFDDGYRDNYTYAFPVLKKYGVPATVFLATDYIGTGRLLWYDRLSWILYNGAKVPGRKDIVRGGLPDVIGERIALFHRSKPQFDAATILRDLAADLKPLAARTREDILDAMGDMCKVMTWPGDGDRPMLSWDEVKEMSREGISFGSHTMSHPVLSSISYSEARREITQSKRIIEDRIQKPVTTFAYPHGKSEDFTEDISAVLLKEGFEYACTTNAGAEQYPIEDPLILKRRGVAPSPYLFF